MSAVSPPSDPPDHDGSTSNSHINSIFDSQSGPWTKKYLVLALEENPEKKTFKSLNPFKVARCIKSFAPQCNFKFARSGTVIIEVTNQKDFYNLKNLKSYEGIPVKFSLHKTLNFCKGLITCDEFLHCTEDELKEELKQFNVVNVKRIHKTVENVKVPTKSLILTFQRSELPERIILDFLSIKVNSYIRPLQCFKCYSYRHGISNCTSDPLCGRCGQSRHEGNCEPKCKHCSEAHPAWSFKCNKYKNEMKVEEYKVAHKVTYAQADRALNNRTQSQPSTSYSEVSSALPTTNAIMDSFHQLTQLVTSLKNQVAHLEAKVSGHVTVPNSTPSAHQVDNHQCEEDEITPMEYISSVTNTSASSSKYSLSQLNPFRHPNKRDRPPSAAESVNAHISLPKNQKRDTKIKKK